MSNKTNYTEKEKVKFRKFIAENKGKMTSAKMAEKLKINIGTVIAISAWVTIKKKFTVGGTFTNVDGIEKKKIRQKKVDAIKKTGVKKGRIMSLPYIRCIMELLIMKQISKNIIFDCFERASTICKKLLKFVIEGKFENINVYNNSIRYGIEQAIKNKTKYISVDLDYCGQLFAYTKEIELAIKGNIVILNGTITITLVKRIHHVFNKEVEKMLKKYPMPIGTKDVLTEHLFKSFLNEVIGNKYVIESFVPYQDKEYDENGKCIHKKQPMMLAIIRRIK